MGQEPGAKGGRGLLPEARIGGAQLAHPPEVSTLRAGGEATCPWSVFDAAFDSHNQVGSVDVCATV